MFFSDVLKLLLQYGAFVNQTDKAHYKTGLHVACEAQSVACVQYLLDAGADPNVQAEQGRTPFHIGIPAFHSKGGGEGGRYLCKSLNPREILRYIADGEVHRLFCLEMASVQILFHVVNFHKYPKL